MNLLCNAGDAGLIPSPAGFHEPRLLAHRLLLLEPAHPGASTLQQDKSVQWEACALQQGSPRLPQLEKAQVHQRRPSMVKNKQIFFKRLFLIFSRALTYFYVWIFFIFIKHKNFIATVDYFFWFCQVLQAGSLVVTLRLWTVGSVQLSRGTWVLVPWPRVKLAPLALQGGFFTSGPQGSSLYPV